MLVAFRGLGLGGSNILAEKLKKRASNYTIENRNIYLSSHYLEISQFSATIVSVSIQTHFHIKFNIY